MNQRVKDIPAHDDEKSKVFLNPDESAFKLLIDKLAYHKKQINFHSKEVNEINRILELMEKYGVTQRNPETISALWTATNLNDVVFYGGGDAIADPSKTGDVKRRDFWMSRAVEYIKSCGILMQTADIFSSAGVKTSETERRSIMSTLSLVMADLCEKGLLKKYKVEGKKGFYYGTPEMFNGDKPIVEF